MKSMSMLLGAAAAIAGFGAAGQADAATISRIYGSHGVASCQAALPAFDASIRKRPLAMSNAGTSNAFVTCDTESISNGISPKYAEVDITFINRSAVATVVSCTLVDGLSFGAPMYFPQSTSSIPPGGGEGISWSTAAKFSAPATSCNLPPGVEIAFVYFNYDEDIGA